jgi:GTPase KRas protein
MLRITPTSSVSGTSTGKNGPGKSGSNESLPPPVAPLIKGRAGSTTAALGTPTAEPASDEYHVVIVGSGGVGKSAMTVLFVHDYFVEQYDPTIEDSYRKQITVDKVPCLLHILDTAGQEDYSAMRDQYMKRGQGFVVVFALTKRNTFTEIEMIRQRIFRAKDRENVPIVVSGNKSDLVDERQVNIQEATQYCHTLGCPFFVTSAKTRQNVEETFMELIREIRKDPIAMADNRSGKRGLLKRCTLL